MNVKLKITSKKIISNYVKPWKDEIASNSQSSTLLGNESLIPKLVVSDDPLRGDALVEELVKRLWQDSGAWSPPIVVFHLGQFINTFVTTITITIIFIIIVITITITIIITIIIIIIMMILLTPMLAPCCKSSLIIFWLGC